MEICQNNFEMAKKCGIIKKVELLKRESIKGMNQILITKKLYVTPELKRKKNMYRAYFIVSVFLVIALISFYIYAEYDRSKEEQVAQNILTSLDTEEPDDTEEMVVLLGEFEDEEAVQEAKNKSKNKNTRKTVHTEDGSEYTSVATVTIPSIGVKYPHNMNKV